MKKYIFGSMKHGYTPIGKTIGIQHLKGESTTDIQTYILTVFGEGVKLTSVEMYSKAFDGEHISNSVKKSKKFQSDINEVRSLVGKELLMF